MFCRLFLHLNLRFIWKFLDVDYWLYFPYHQSIFKCHHSSYYLWKCSSVLLSMLQTYAGPVRNKTCQPFRGRPQLHSRLLPVAYVEIPSYASSRRNHQLAFSSHYVLRSFDLWWINKKRDMQYYTSRLCFVQFFSSVFHTPTTAWTQHQCMETRTSIWFLALPLFWHLSNRTLSKVGRCLHFTVQTEITKIKESGWA